MQNTIDDVVERWLIHYYIQEEDCVRLNEELYAAVQSVQSPPPTASDEELQNLLLRRSDLMRRLDTSLAALGISRTECARRGWDVDQLQLRRHVNRTTASSEIGWRVSSWLGGVVDVASPVEPNQERVPTPSIGISGSVLPSRTASGPDLANFASPRYQPVERADIVGPLDSVEEGIVRLPSVLARRDPRVYALYNTFGQRTNSEVYFTVGKVFMALWSEPTHTQDSSSPSGYDSFTGKYGEQVGSVISTFVIIWRGQYHSLALPILKYGGLGVAAQGVVKADHSIIFTGAQEPQPHPHELPTGGELPMQNKSIGVSINGLDAGLAPMSRINYGKVYTIPHSLRVRHIGKVHDHMMPYLVENWRNVLQLAQQAESDGDQGAQPKSSMSERFRAASLVRPQQISAHGLQARYRSTPKSDSGSTPYVGAYSSSKPVAQSTPASPQMLAPGYKKRKPDFFKCGRVFSMLHTEADDESVVSEGSFPGRYGERLFSNIRHFVVIRESKYYCLVLPIVYDSRRSSLGPAKVSEQGLIFASLKAPTVQNCDDPCLQPVAIYVRPDIVTERLEQTARIHYGRVHTVSHHVRVKPFGMVFRVSMRPLLEQAKAVFQVARNFKHDPTPSETS